MSPDTVNAAVEIQLDKPRLLQFNAYAFIRYEEEIGHELLLDLRKLAEQFKANAGAPEKAGFPFATIRNILWAGLVEEDEKLTRDHVARSFNVRDITTLSEALMLAIRRSVPTEADNDRPTPAKSGESRKLRSAASGSGSSPSSESRQG